MKKFLSKLISAVLASSLVMSSMSFVGVGPMAAVSVAAADTISVQDSGGWFESAYIEWLPVSNAAQYVVYCKKSGDSSYTMIDDELIRQYDTYWRADVVGLAKGTYDLKVDAYGSGGAVIASAEKTGLTVNAYDRSGAAFSKYSTLYSSGGVGAYKNDGTLKDTARVLYITKDTAKTVTADVITSNKGSETFVGLQAILAALEKGYDKRGFAIRFIGKVSLADLDYIASSDEGIQIKGKAYTELNVTLEGIGEDAAVSDFGFLVRNAGNIEFRNFEIMNFIDDAISLDTKNCNVWIHNMDFVYGGPGGDSDQAKGDGTVDMKGDSTFLTISYNHFMDSGKSSLCGMKSETTTSHITYHHNWFDHSDSRHPRIRTMSVHIYNNYFDGNAKYGVGMTMGGSAFVESNYFKDVTKPMMISKQGTDAKGAGTFSGEAGGIIKACNNEIVYTSDTLKSNASFITNTDSATDFDAVVVSNRTDSVPSSYKAVSGGSTYNNFDTDTSKFDLGVSAANITAAADVPSVVMASAGRMGGGDFPGANRSSYPSLQDTATAAKDYAVDTVLKSAILNYTSPVVKVGGTVSGDPIITTEATTSSEVPSEVTTGDTEVTTGEETETTTEKPVVTGPVGDQIHNYTDTGKDSDFYEITGNISTSKGTVNYNGIELTDCLKMESSTSIKFSNGVDGKITLVFGGTTDPSGKTVKFDGTACTVGSDGLATIDVAAGSHTITKGDTINMFYMSYSDNGSGEQTEATTAATTEATTAATTEATTAATTEATTEASTSAPSEDKATIISDQTLNVSNYSDNAYFYVAYTKLSDSNTSLQLSSSSETADKIKFTVAAGATVTASAKHASSDTAAADRYISMTSGSSIALKQGSGFQTVTLGENLAAGTYEITVSGSINIQSVSVAFPTAAAKIGDADGNGTVDKSDVKLVLDYASGKSVTLNSDLADVNGKDGVTAYDAYLIGKIILGLLSV